MIEINIHGGTGGELGGSVPEVSHSELGDGVYVTRYLFRNYEDAELQVTYFMYRNRQNADWLDQEIGLS